LDSKTGFSSVAEALAKATFRIRICWFSTDLDSLVFSLVAVALAKATPVAEALAKETFGFGYFGFSENLFPKKEKLIDIGF
jgi:hypothetical protein